MLSVNNLCYQYEDVPLLQFLNFKLVSGEILHIRGANGRGKTTLLKLLAGLVRPTSGHVQWQSDCIQNIWSRYCQQRLYLGHELALKENLSVRENIQFNFPLQLSAASTHVEVLHDSMNELGLFPYQQYKIYELSPGVKKKISLLRLCINQCTSEKYKLWLLDEPFTTLDTTGQQWLANTLHAFIAAAGIVVMTSHLNPSIAVHRTIHLDG